MILLTRNSPYLASQLALRGYRVRMLPLMRNIPLLLSRQEQAWQQQSFDHVFVASRYAGSLWPLHHHAKATFWAPGKATGHWLSHQFAKVHWPPVGEGIAALTDLPSGRWLILAPEQGRSQQLATVVSEPHVATLYRSMIVDRAVAKIRRSPPSTIVVSSQRVAEAILRLPRHPNHRYIVSSERVASCFLQAGLQFVLVAKGATDAALLETILAKV